MVADALGVVRLLAALALPRALAEASRAPLGGWLPLALFALAAVTDFLDGVLARRGRGPTRHGAVLDNGADLAFVLAGTGTGAALGLLPGAVPGAIVVAFGAYVLASLYGSLSGRSWRLARSPVGHAAGVLNYGLVGLLAAAVALPAPGWPAVLRGASLVVIAVNLAAVAARVLPGPLPRARGRPGAGRGDR